MSGTRRGLSPRLCNDVNQGALILACHSLWYEYFLIEIEQKHPREQRTTGPCPYVQCSKSCLYFRGGTRGGGTHVIPRECRSLFVLLDRICRDQFNAGDRCGEGASERSLYRLNVFRSVCASRNTGNYGTYDSGIREEYLKGQCVCYWPDAQAGEGGRAGGQQDDREEYYPNMLYVLTVRYPLATRVLLH